jgi:2-C-methyl-D-erythritol 2,4-cyclodiphosphate synthase
MRIGIGYDSHRFSEGCKLILGGAEIPFEKGLISHSDGDVLCHAIIDAILGALGEGDIGLHFPDNDQRWNGASSVGMLKTVVEMAGMKGFRIDWIDCVVIAEKPRLGPYMEAMKQALSKAGIVTSLINLKTKTNEGMGFTGRGEGIAAQAVCLLDEIK